jgi:O-antigen ligase
MMFKAMVSESAVRRLALCFWTRLHNDLRQCIILRLLLKSRILIWLTDRLPAVSGAAAAFLFVLPHDWFNNTYSLIVLSCLTGLLLLGVIGGRVKTAALPRIGRYAAAYWFFVVFAFLTSQSISQSLRFFLFHLTAFLALAFILSLIKDRRSLLSFVTPLLAAVTASGLYGLAQSVTGVDVKLSQVDYGQHEDMPGRIYSFYENPNNFAEILVLTLPLFAALFFMAKTGPCKRLALFAAIPPAMALVLTFSRSGWMALALGIAVFFFFTYRWVVPVMFGAALAAFPFLPSTVTDRFLSTFGGTDSSILFREFVKDTYAPVLDGQYLTGTGLGNDVVRDRLIGYYNARPEMKVLWWQIAPHAHNHWLQIWAEIGLAGAAAFFGMMADFVRRCAAALFRPQQKNFIAAAGLAGVVGVLLMGFAEYIWFYPRTHLLFWIVVGVTLAALQVGEEAEKTGTGRRV